MREVAVLPEQALLLLNDWLGRTVRIVIVIRDGAPLDEEPPAGPAPGWHVLLAHDGTLQRPLVRNDSERQLTIGTYVLGDGTPKVLLEDLPCERVLIDEAADRLLIHLPGASVVAVLQAV